jgi:non-ribosomal peptide synthetase-like protein
MLQDADTANPRLYRQLRQEPTLLHEYFERQVKRRPDHPAIEFESEVLTYAELDCAANHIAHALLDRGIGPGALVGLYLHKSVDLFAAMLGILKAGAGYVPIDPKFPADRITDILSDSAAGLVISSSSLADNLGDSVVTPLLLLDQEEHQIAAQLTCRPDFGDALTANDLCYAIYTSGSTGRPKGVLIEHRNAVAFVRALRVTYGVRSSDRIYQGFSTAFDASVEEVWAAFATGATLVVPEESVCRSPHDAAEFIHDRRITYFSTVPTFLAMIDRELPHVRTLVLGGEVCTPDLVKRWATGDRRMLNTYGPTEATVVATMAECRPGVRVTIGHALPGYTTHVLDEQGAPVTIGEVGELYIGGAALARGYKNLPEMTAQRFIVRPSPDGAGEQTRLYRTFDHVRLLAGGEIEFIGRADGQIKLRGFRIELPEIEAVLIEQPAIRAAAVRVVEQGDMRELAAYVVTDADHVLDRGRLAEALRARLPEYMVPKFLDEIDALPLMTSGKVDRKQLPEPCQPLVGRRESVVEAADDIERTVVAVWQNQLGIDPISVEDDFFTDLQGHSLIAAKMIVALRAAVGCDRLSVRDVYKHRTARAFAGHIRTLGVRESTSTSAPPASSTSELNILTAARAAYLEVHPLVRWTTVFLQALSVVVYYGILASPLALATLIMLARMDHRLGVAETAWLLAALGFLTWPTMLLLGILVKWTVIGRYRPGRYPVWGTYYFRWWLATRFQALSWSEMLVGTPLMSLYFRAMGASVGANVTLGTNLCTAFDVVRIADGASIGAETHMLGCRVEDGYLIIDRIDIGKNCFVGQHCAIGLGTRMGDGACLDDLSLLGDGMRITPGQSWRGSPAAPAEAPKSDGRPAPAASSRARRALFGALHLLLIYAMGCFLVLAALPALVLPVVALMYYGPFYAALSVVACVPLTILWYMVCLVAVKRLIIGKVVPGVYPVTSAQYLRHWFLEYLLRNTRTILLPLYATMFTAAFFRLLGARIGSGCEVSTVTQVSPDLLQIGSGSFLADGCLVGGHRIDAGSITVEATSIGDRTFIGNSAFVPGGADIGSDVLVGVMSTPPTELGRVPDNTRWLGSPAFNLPHTQRDATFSSARTFAPPRHLRVIRGCIDLLRIVLPGLIISGALMAFITGVAFVWEHLPPLGIAVAISFLATGLAYLAVYTAACIKWLLLGKLGPTVRPLWSAFVWRNELVNGVYEMIGATAMAPLLGTPFASGCLRMMGCRVGKWAFVDTTLFSEFDLVEIGDHAALNIGTTIQTHLFEDRVFKANHLRIGDGCSVGNMSVVLYGTEMRAGSSLAPLGVLMKGEILPERTRWSGIPCERVEATLSPVFLANHAVAERLLRVPVPT